MNGPIGCWHPLTEARMAPHTILRDLNQLLYRIFNSKKVRDNFGFLAFSGGLLNCKVALLRLPFWLKLDFLLSKN